MKVIFICTSNLCRSPLAVAVLKEKLASYNLDVEIDSAGLEPFHINDTPDSKAQELVKAYQYDIADHRARLLTVEDFEEADYIFAMDTISYQGALYLTKNKEHRKKLDYLMNQVNSDSNESIPEPHNRNLENCSKAMDKIIIACEALANNIVAKLAS